MPSPESKRDLRDLLGPCAAIAAAVAMAFAGCVIDPLGTGTGPGTGPGPGGGGGFATSSSSSSTGGIGGEGGVGGEGGEGGVGGEGGEGGEGGIGGAGGEGGAGGSPPLAPEGPPMSVGFNFTCGVKSGEVFCFGSGALGEMGNGTNTAINETPVMVSGIANAVAVQAGEQFACALLADGAVKCWGKAFSNGTDAGSNVPVDVPNISDAERLASAFDHSCVVHADKTVSCWGFNLDGELGDGTTTTSETPVAVQGLSGDALEVATGLDHSCALIDGGTVQCWGDNSNGQLGDGSFNDSLTPVDVSGLTNAVSISSWGGHTCALDDTGAAFCWGRNQKGQIGDGMTIGGMGGQNTPAAVVGGLTFKAIATGDNSTCAVDDNDDTYCWGFNGDGQLCQVAGPPDTDSSVPVPMLDDASETITTSVVAKSGFTTSCAYLSDDTIWCCGRNSFGQLGAGNVTAGKQRFAVVSLF